VDTTEPVVAESRETGAERTDIKRGDDQPADEERGER
jgi:hypothetical protein